MPRFYFDIHDGCDIRDEHGCDLPTIRAAQVAGLKYAGALVSDLPETFWAENDWRMDIKDERGLILFSLLFVAIESPAMAQGQRPPMAMPEARAALARSKQLATSAREAQERGERRRANSHDAHERTAELFIQAQLP